MSYVDFYLQARSASDKIAEEGGFKTPSRDTANGFVARKPRKEPEKSPQTGFSEMVLEYMKAVRDLPSPTVEQPEPVDTKADKLEPFGGAGKPLTDDQKLLYGTGRNVSFAVL